ncbi:hypothetical protein SAMN06295888_13711 [Desulfonatronum zhilinae]|nr:hypothetical protein SAMN06295888_13711 [Desulfonatronum zhilinae]
MREMRAQSEQGGRMTVITGRRRVGETRVVRERKTTPPTQATRRNSRRFSLEDMPDRRTGADEEMVQGLIDFHSKRLYLS